MKSQITNLGYSPSIPNKTVVENFLTRFYSLGISDTGALETRILGREINLIQLGVDKLTNRIMSGDMTFGIATLADFIASFSKQGKIPLAEASSFGFFDKKYRGKREIFKCIGDGLGEDGLQDANRFGFRATGETEEIYGRTVPLYDIVFDLEDRKYGEESDFMDAPVCVVSRRTLRKNPDVRAVLKDMSEKANELYYTSSYYRHTYPRG